MKNVPASLQAILDLDRVPYSQRTHQTRPDGLDMSSMEDGKCNAHYWEDLAVTMEFKKKNIDHLDVRPASN